MADLPRGCEFNPTDQLMVQFLVERRADHPQPSAYIVDDLHFYDRTPEHLREGLEGRERGYFFTQVARQTRPSSSRSNAHGIWKPDHVQREIKAEGSQERIGSKRVWRYKRQPEGQGPVSLHLCVVEYTHVLQGNGDKEWVLLKLYRTRMRRGRNDNDNGVHAQQEQGPVHAEEVPDNIVQHAQLLVGHLPHVADPTAAWNALEASVSRHLTQPTNPQGGLIPVIGRDQISNVNLAGPLVRYPAPEAEYYSARGCPAANVVSQHEIGESSHQNEDDLNLDELYLMLFPGFLTDDVITPNDVPAPAQGVVHQNIQDQQQNGDEYLQYLNLDAIEGQDFPDQNPPDQNILNQQVGDDELNG